MVVNLGAEKKEDDMLKSGSIEVIVGGMYSGKTEELLRRVRRAEYAGQRILVIKPEKDNRYSETEIVSHYGSRIKSVSMSDISTVDYESLSDISVVAIDEGQFFGANLPSVCKKLADSGIRVIVAGLDMDFNTNPFLPMPELMSMAEEVTKLRAICVKCGKDALYSYRTIKSEEIVCIGGKESYEARCRGCYKL